MDSKLCFKESERILIINADDFGIVSEQMRRFWHYFNTAITSASIMIPCPAARVFCEKPLHSLINSDNEFFTDIAYIETNADLDEVRIELQAQIKFAISQGIECNNMPYS
jgi:predicted glycoside hydrolase/deacetylase ChbG (UPF0249 family)